MEALEREVPQLKAASGAELKTIRWPASGLSIHPEIGETEQLAQWLLSPSRHLRGEGFRITRCFGSRRDFFREDGNVIRRASHAILVYGS
jgi:hypothetical protein